MKFLIPLRKNLHPVSIHCTPRSDLLIDTDATIPTKWQSQINSHINSPPKLSTKSTQWYYTNPNIADKNIQNITYYSVFLCWWLPAMLCLVLSCWARHDCYSNLHVQLTMLWQSHHDSPLGNLWWLTKSTKMVSQSCTKCRRFKKAEALLSWNLSTIPSTKLKTLIFIFFQELFLMIQ